LTSASSSSSRSPFSARRRFVARGGIERALVERSPRALDARASARARVVAKCRSSRLGFAIATPHFETPRALPTRFGPREREAGGAGRVDARAARRRARATREGARAVDNLRFRARDASKRRRRRRATTRATTRDVLEVRRRSGAV
jgi:hypothetical protein